MLHFIWIGFLLACGFYCFNQLAALLSLPGVLHAVCKCLLIAFVSVVAIGLAIFAFVSVPSSWLRSLHDIVRGISIPEGLAAFGLLSLLMRGRSQSNPVQAPDARPDEMKNLMGM